jgi:hypothetical protein
VTGITERAESRRSFSFQQQKHPKRWRSAPPLGRRTRRKKGRAEGHLPGEKRNMCCCDTPLPVELNLTPSEAVANRPGDFRARH